MTRSKTSVMKRPNSSPKVTNSNFFLRLRGRFILCASGRVQIPINDPTPGRQVIALEKTMPTTGSPRRLSRLPANDLQAALLSQNLQTLDRERSEERRVG